MENKLLKEVFQQSGSETKTNPINSTMDAKINANAVIATANMNINTPTIIHWNDTQIYKTRPTIYKCTSNLGNGMRESQKILEGVLPEYNVFDLSTIRIDKGRFYNTDFLQENYTNDHDVFFTTFSFGKCGEIINRWLLTHFNGHIVLFSGEDEIPHPAPGRSMRNMHAFGPLIDPKPQDLVLYYLQLVWWDKYQDKLTPASMVYPEKRPRGNKTHFMIYANSNCAAYREEAVGLLSEYGIIHCDGKCTGKGGNRTNIVKTENPIGIRNWWVNVELFSNYRFCFVMEHQDKHAAYITEKILNAFSAGCIPIYYGIEKIFDIFNPNAFVFYNISNPQPALEQIKELENNETMYENMMSEAIVLHGEKTIEKYFSFNHTIGNGAIMKEIRKKLGIVDGSSFVP